jgi:hypothetical protein
MAQLVAAAPTTDTASHHHGTGADATAGASSDSVSSAASGGDSVGMPGSIDDMTLQGSSDRASLHGSGGAGSGSTSESLADHRGGVIRAGAPSPTHSGSHPFTSVNGMVVRKRSVVPLIPLQAPPAQPPVHISVVEAKSGGGGSSSDPFLSGGVSSPTHVSHTARDHGASLATTHEALPQPLSGSVGSVSSSPQDHGHDGFSVQP